MRNNTKKGFTLVELLVVIAILAILATVSVVGYTSFIEGASLQVDEDLATQLNHFLEAYKVNNRGEITPDNIWEVTDELLELGGLEELQTQTDGYKFFFKFDGQGGGEFIVASDDDIINKSLMHALWNALVGAEDYLKPGFFEYNGELYFIVDTTGSDLANAVRGFYTLDGFEGETTPEKVAEFFSLATGMTGAHANIAEYANNSVFVTDEGNYVVDATATHSNIYIYDEAAYVDNRKYEVSTNEETKGQITDVVTLDEETPIIVVNTNTTIVIPEGVMLPTYSLNVGVSKEGTEVKIVIESNNWGEIESTVDAEFTNENVTIVINGKEYKLVEEGDQIVTNDENKTPAANLGSNFPLTDFNLAVKFVENKVVNTLTELGESANSGYVALDIAGGFTFNFIDVNQTSGGPASKPVVDWEIVSLVVDGAVVENTADYIKYIEVDENTNTFTFVRDKGFLPKVDKVVVKATTTYDENGEEKTFSKEYTVDVVRVKSVGVTVGGDDVLVDGKANLLCNSSNGATLATNFNVVPDLTILNEMDGIVLDATANLSFTPSDHVHTQACCPHEHDESCNGGCNHEHGVECVLQCSHTQHTTECCGHVHDPSTCYSGSECTHVLGGTHLDEGQTTSSCYTGCTHTTANTGHSYSCSAHYLEWIQSGKDDSLHTNECCGHFNGTYHTSACGGKTGTCKFVSGEIAHSHDKKCCMHYNSNTRGIDFRTTSEYCAHVHGINGEEYHVGDCGSCIHTTADHEANCAGELICGHDVDGHECDECVHGTEKDPHDSNCQTCEFACTGRQDCLICTHDCERDGCLTDANCKYGSQSAVLNGTTVTGNGNASGTLTIKIGSEGSYYSTYTAEINFYGAFDVDSNNNITHLGSVAVGTATHSNAIRVEDLFGDNIPTDAVIAIFGEIINPDQDDIINPNRILLANAEEAKNLADKDTPISFWVADNIIEYKNGAWEEIKFYGEGEAYIAVITDYNVDDYGNLTGVRTSKDIEATVVVAKNVRDYADFDTTGGSNVILNDIRMPQNGRISFAGGTIYGNHHTFDIQAGVTTGYNGIITLNNTNMQDLRVIGALYPQVGIAGPDPYGTNAVLAKGNVTITNCYIANTRAPLASGYETGAHNIVLNNTILFGGRYANIDLRGGNLTFEGTVITINQPHTKENDVASVELNDRIVGLGVVVWVEAPAGTKISGVENLVQYNFVSEKYTNIPDVTIKYDMNGTNVVNETIYVSGLYTEVFGKSDKYGQFYFGSDDRYLNASIICEDLGDMATNPVLGSLNLPSGDRTGLKDNVPDGYGREQYATTVVNGAYTIYLHMYGIINSTQENQDLFTASQGAEYTYSPWIHTVNGEYVPAYDFGSDNSIIAQ